jgi:glycosyltransferase involved in cell wall biosynthesis
MFTGSKARIAIVAGFYSEGMGYSENCLSRALARRGHDVHVVTSTYNVYGNEPLYQQTYESFLGPARTSPGSRFVDGYQLHRLDTELISGYLRLKGLTSKIRAIRPDVVHSLEVASLQTWELACARPLLDFRLFCESHQNMSVVRPYMRNPNGEWMKRAGYRLTRTLPTYLASLAIERCYAVAPDCAEVVRRFYGVPSDKVTVMSLGADTETFHPVENGTDRTERDALRGELGFTTDDVVCVYTGRFTGDKNPLVLAKAIDALAVEGARFKGLFIGDGVQRREILSCRNTTVVPFMTHQQLSAHYRAADIGVWPRQESMSMIDAASSGLPLIVSDRMGEPERIDGNGTTYGEDDVRSMIAAIQRFSDPAVRAAHGAVGRRRMLAGFSWSNFAEALERDFLKALGCRAA